VATSPVGGIPHEEILNRLTCQVTTSVSRQWMERQGRNGVPDVLVTGRIRVYASSASAGKAKAGMVHSVSG